MAKEKDDKRRLLAFYSPYPGAGKTTAARRAFDGRRCKKYRIAFADPLYDIVASISAHLGLAAKHGELRDRKDEPLPELGGASVRDLLIGFGAKGREIFPDLWVEYMRGRLSNFSRIGETWIAIDDLRFPNEYAMLREEGAKIVRVTVPGREIVPSETEALLEGFAFDAELVNLQEDMRTFDAQVDVLCRDLFPGGWA